ncbi:hypothetical protein [Flavicella sp.]|uniref:hypothetical protein n=1 Tax=Flavicella sp. TaxID=2957742 RepID=UPI00301B555E
MKEAFLEVYQALKLMSSNSDLLCVQFWLKIKKLHENYDEEAVWQLMFDNMIWLINTNVLTSAYLKSNFTLEELSSHKIYFQDKVIIKNNRGILFGTAKAEVSGHSLIVQFENSETECYDTTFVTLFDQSKTTAHGCLVNAFNQCEVIGKGYAKIEAWDNVAVSHTSTDFVVLKEGARKTKK